MGKTPASAERAAVPLAALNPYRTPWTVKVKLTNKGNVREYKSARGPGKVCSVDFVDEEGTAIGATLWREAIEKYDSVLEVGKVYYVSKGSLKPADKRYSTSGNDYEMNLDGKCEIDVCNDIDQSSAQKMQRAYAFVPINKLASKIGARGNVDVVAVVKEVSELSSIRRKSDNTELNKREVVLVDDSAKTVRLTLWNALAVEVGEQFASVITKASPSAPSPALTSSSIRRTCRAPSKSKSGGLRAAPAPKPRPRAKVSPARSKVKRAKLWRVTSPSSSRRKSPR